MIIHQINLSITNKICIRLKSTKKISLVMIILRLTLITSLIKLNSTLTTTNFRRLLINCQTAFTDKKNYKLLIPSSMQKPCIKLAQPFTIWMILPILYPTINEDLRLNRKQLAKRANNMQTRLIILATLIQILIIQNNLCVASKYV